jgi:hypothetical protein
VWRLNDRRLPHFGVAEGLRARFENGQGEKINYLFVLNTGPPRNG